jgi:hypothetical protein
VAPVLALRTRAHQLAPEAGLLSSDDTVGRLLKQRGYTLQRTQKTEEGAQHPDRDAQFRYVNEQAKTHLPAGQPVVSVDTKKKELVGRYANGGAEWQPAGSSSGSGCTTSPTPRSARRSLRGLEVLFEVGGSERCAYRLSFARTYAISTAGCTLSSKVPERPRGAPNLSPRPIPNRLGNPGSLGRNELVGKNRGQAEGLSRRISATRAGCSRAAKCPL